MEAPNAEASISQENRLTPQFRTYKSPEGVEVGVAKFSRESDVQNKNAVVYLMGWPWSAKDETTRAFPAQLAENLKTTCYSIDTVNAKGDKKALALQGQAIGQFLMDEGMEEVTFVAHSTGAVKAAYTIYALQHTPSKVKVNALVLVDPMGLNQRWTLGLLKDLVRDAGWVAPKERKIGGVKAGKEGPVIETVTPRQATKEVWENLKRISKTGKLGIPRLWSQREAIKNKDPIFSELGNVPVWIIAGGKDNVSNYKNYLLPDQEARKIATAPKSEQEDMFRLAKVRSELAKKYFSPQAKVKVTVTGRQADHGGIVAARGEQTSKIIAGILKKIHV